MTTELPTEAEIPNNITEIPNNITGLLTEVLSEFELVGNGRCAISPNCTDWECTSSYFSRYTKPAYISQNTEYCAQEAIIFGAIAFFVSEGSCQLIPEVDPQLADSAKCPSASKRCPARSPYGSYYAYDWEWYTLSGGVAPVQGVLPDFQDNSYTCYK